MCRLEQHQPPYGLFKSRKKNMSAAFTSWDPSKPHKPSISHGFPVGFWLEDQHYDLHDRRAFAQFLVDANIRLVPRKSKDPGLFMAET